MADIQIAGGCPVAATAAKIVRWERGALMRLTILLVTVVSAISVAPATAQIRIATYTGVITSGTDPSGLFGTAGSSLSGDSFKASYTYDLGLGYRETNLPTYDALYGGATYGTPITKTTIIINGIARDNTYRYGQEVAYFPTQNQALGLVAGYNDNNVTYNLLNAPGLTSLDQNLSVSGSGSGYFAIRHYNYAYGELVTDSLANLITEGLSVSGGETPDPSHLSASALASWAAFISTGRDNQTQMLTDAAINCPETPGCDIDQAQANLQVYNLKEVSLANSAATSSEDFVNFIGVNPFKPVELASFLVTNTTAVFDNALSAVELIRGSFKNADKLFSLQQASGYGYDLVGGKGSEKYYNLNLVGSIDVSQLSDLAVGSSFTTTIQTSPHSKLFLVGTIEGLIDPPEIGTIYVNLRGIETSTVAEPATWLTMIFGFGLAGSAMRRRLAPNS